MPDDVYRPFDEDVEKGGAYVYTDAARRSAQYVNRRFSRVTQAALDFRGKRVVDVGCGDGTYTAELYCASGAASVLGIDPAGKAIERARNTYREEGNTLDFRQCFARDLVAEHRQFDIAVYRGTIHHVGRPAEEIAMALRLARTVFLLEANGMNPVVKLLERFSAYHRKHEERSYPMRTLKRWVRAAGGAVEHASFFGLVPIFCPAWFVSIGAALEPFVERVPLLRGIVCGQIAMVASRVAGANGISQSGMEQVQ
ncbi:MAG TPA: class I SAM-dependent methyltransferase [Candidatus Hydrogenedentes bacterium]|nr:class I SAM-dependent methyltransferase [Candidatus Hydrogenedentota bacterium]